MVQIYFGHTNSPENESSGLVAAKVTYFPQELHSYC